MKKEHDIYYAFFYRLFFVLLLVCVCVLGAGTWFGIYEVSIWQITAAFLVACFLNIFSFAKSRGRILCAILLAGCLSVGFWLTEHHQMETFWLSYQSWLLHEPGWNEEWLSRYGCVQAVYVAVGCYLLWWIAERFTVMKRLYAWVIGADLLVCLIAKEPVSHIGVACMVLYLLLIYIESTQRKWKKVQKHDEKQYVLWLMPFCAVYFFLFCIMPAPRKPFEWTFVKTAYQQIREAAIVCYQNLSRGEKEDFGLAFSGFSEDGTLGAGLISDSRVLLEIEGEAGLMTNIYLSGKIYDTFDGKGWTQNATGDTKDRFLDTMETLYAVERFSEGAARDYVYGTKLRVRYQYLDTGYVFTPLKTWAVEESDCRSDGPNLVFDRQRGYGTEYTTGYYQINVDHPVFYEMMEAHPASDGSLWNTLVHRHKLSDVATLAKLKKHRTDIYEDYGNAPVLSDEVKAYLEEITEEADTDVEKLRAIEDALSSYTYTKRPGKLPESVVDENSYLDYFLLESRQGYCSYFATAFVLLVRAEGIPARYVEGFCVPVNKEKQMTVYSNMAHAWPEAYIDGVGWIPFEPTPGYEKIRYTPWETKSESGVRTGKSALADEMAKKAQQETKDVKEVQPQPKAIGFGQKNVILWGCFFTLLVIFFIFLLDHAIRYFRYVHMQIKEQFLVEIRKNLWVLKHFGLTRAETETIGEFQERVRKKLAEKLNDEFEFLTCYEEVLYGGKEITPAMLQCARDERAVWMQWVKKTRRTEYVLLKLWLSFAGRWW